MDEGDVAIVKKYVAPKVFDFSKTIKVNMPKAKDFVIFNNHPTKKLVEKACREQKIIVAYIIAAIPSDVMGFRDAWLKKNNLTPADLECGRLFLYWGNTKESERLHKKQLIHDMDNVWWQPSPNINGIKGLNRFKKEIKP